MNFGMRDFQILMVMLVFCIIISFLFPPLGFSSEDINETELPQFNASQDRYSYMNESANFPSRPTQGTLTYINNSESWEDGRQVDLQTGNPRYTLSFFDTTPSQPTATYEVNLIKFNDTGSYTEDTVITENNTTKLTSVDGSYEVGLTNMQVIRGDPNNEASVDWEVVSQPSDQTWIGRIPGVGGIISGANQLAAIVGWIGSIIFTFVYNLSATGANITYTIFDIIVFVVDIMTWLTTTYASVVAGAPTSWASLIVAIPGVLLSLEFMKLIAVIISLLPTT